MADQVSELGEDVFAARTAECGRSAECGMRRAAGGCLRSAVGVRSAECGRPVFAELAGTVCGAGRCLRSAECGSCGLHIAGPADIRGARTAEYCGLVRSTEFCYLIRQAVLFRQATVGVAQVSEPADTECSGASQRRSAECGTQQGLKLSDITRVCNRLAASFPPTRILERSLGTLILQYTYMNTDNPFHKLPTLFGPILSFLHFPRFPLVPV